VGRVRQGGSVGPGAVIPEHLDDVQVDAIGQHAHHAHAVVDCGDGARHVRAVVALVGVPACGVAGDGLAALVILVGRVEARVDDTDLPVGARGGRPYQRSLDLIDSV